ncbi:MAG: DinB family protein [Bacteroidota bacterium]
MQRKEMITKWRGHKNYLLKVVERMPEADFDYQPIETVKSFRSQVSHITSWLRTHSKLITGNDLGRLATKDREGLLAAIAEFFDLFLDYLKQSEDSDWQEVVDVWYGKSTKHRILSVMDNHLAHHRGQMIVYLRLRGIEPPSYRAW